VVSADPLWAHLGLCFHVVAILWVLWLVPGVDLDLRRFGCVSLILFNHSKYIVLRRKFSKLTYLKRLEKS
jgi:hypothetical protein